MLARGLGVQRHAVRPCGACRAAAAEVGNAARAASRAHISGHAALDVIDGLPNDSAANGVQRIRLTALTPKTDAQRAIADGSSHACLHVMHVHVSHMLARARACKHTCTLVI